MTLLRDRHAVIGGVLIGVVTGVVTLLAVFGPWLAPFGYETVDMGAVWEAPGGEHLMGADTLGAPKTVFYQPGVFDGDESSGLDYSKTGVPGDPTLATAEKGEALLSAMAKELVEGLKQLYPKALA